MFSSALESVVDRMRASNSMSKANLKGANVSYIRFYFIKLEDADLSEIRSFGSSIRTGTAWWLVKKIEPELLRYLEKEYPFKKRGQYANAEVTEDTYRQRLAVLHQSE